MSVPFVPAGMPVSKTNQGAFDRRNLALIACPVTPAALRIGFCHYVDNLIHDPSFQKSNKDTGSRTNTKRPLQTSRYCRDPLVASCSALTDRYIVTERSINIDGVSG
ncbi:hypothetical protein BaRGS_00015623 [Batillaria attramentaria]|uniref:Uncharacterized protein n=1 Tax=Batillaria attramentaria TaxID=370345 RepID=A0ABD0L116_9CAEN